MESVDDLAQEEQIGRPAEAAQCSAVIRRRVAAGVICAPIGPIHGDQRAAAVGQADK